MLKLIIACLDGVEHVVVDHRVHGEGDRVGGEDLLAGHLEHLGPDVDQFCVLKERQYEHQTWTPYCSLHAMWK